MIPIRTKLTTSGNSVAVRLPKELLKMSGLGEVIELSAKKGQIVISVPQNVRAGWPEQIARAAKPKQDETFTDMHVASNDGLHDLDWNGPSYEQWQKKHG